MPDSLAGFTGILQSRRSALRRILAAGRTSAARAALYTALLCTLALPVLAGCSNATPAPPAERATATPRIRRSYLPTEQPAGPAVVKEEANLRAGPGTEFERLGSAAPGETVTLAGRNAAGDWYQLDTGAWIAAFLVEGAPAGLPVVDAGSGTAAAPGVAVAMTTPGPAPAAVPAGAVAARLSRVVDGDTVEVVVEGKTEMVRYIGVDTPERGQAGYQSASDANAALLGQGTLWLAPDRSDRDRYDRLLRYVYNADGVMVNQALVAQGWAQPLEYPPDTAYAAVLRQAAVEAAQGGRGFWSGWAPDGAAPYALTMGKVNLRRGPGVEFAISVTTPDNTPLAVFGRTADGRWLQVRAPDRSGGWAAAGLVALRAPLEQIPVLQNVPELPAGAAE